MKLEFPYGLADFRRLILEGCLYIDRTDYIPLIEEAGRQQHAERTICCLFVHNLTVGRKI